MPFSLNVPTLGILAATLVDFGTHEQKLRHLPAILKGEELWVQFLSEPSGGSDLAGVLTRAERDGDVYILNGSKIWSSGAAESDYAMCLARTNWDVPKHRGLTMFIMKIHQPGVQVEQIRQVDGSLEFCQEFFDDVPIPAADVIGEVDDGWTVATRLLVHERNAVGGGSPYLQRPRRQPRGGRRRRPARRARAGERAHRAIRTLRQLVAEAAVRQLVGQHLVLPGHAGRDHRGDGAAGQLGAEALQRHRARCAASRSASSSPGPTRWCGRRASDGPGRAIGEFSLWRQGLSLGGGSNEIQRNIISERLLGMPREFAADRDVPYRDVKRGGSRG